MLRVRTTILAFLLLWASAKASEGVLDQLREDVRPLPATESVAPASPQPEKSEESRKPDGLHASDFGRDHDSKCAKDDDKDGDGFSFGGLLLAAATSPLWVPHFAVGDDLLEPLSFERFPYETGEGRMLGGELLTGEPKTSSWQWRSEYVYQSPRINRLGGRLLFEGASRLGISTEFGRLSELRNGVEGSLWLGNCNFLLRFAQSEQMQWRVGVGANWLADRGAGNAGFNLTYGFDYFPFRPLVASTELDWGTLGNADLFRFRVTGGVVWRHLEAYTGYEYLDIGRTQLNGIIGGVRLWY